MCGLNWWQPIIPHNVGHWDSVLLSLLDTDRWDAEIFLISVIEKTEQLDDVTCGLLEGVGFVDGFPPTAAVMGMREPAVAAGNTDSVGLPKEFILNLWSKETLRFFPDAKDSMRRK